MSGEKKMVVRNYTALFIDVQLERITPSSNGINTRLEFTCIDNTKNSSAYATIERLIWRHVQYKYINNGRRCYLCSIPEVRMKSLGYIRFSSVLDTILKNLQQLEQNLGSSS